MDERQKQAFQDRLARIGTSPTPILAGVDDSIVEGPAKPSRRYEATEDTFKERLAYPLSFVWAFFFGVLSVFLGRFAIAHLIGPMEDGDSMTLYLIDIGLAGAVAFVISAMLRSAEKEKVTTSMIGVFLAVSTMHNLVWYYPHLFAMIYTEDWVISLLQRSLPNSIFFRGEYILIE
ncbi:MAG: hypothetical protein AAGF53_14150 [Pseudomonadota bacterium]